MYSLLLVTTGGATLAFGLARGDDRVPKRVWAIFALVLLAFYGGALVGGDVLLPLDNLRGDPPFRALPPAEPHGNLLQGDLVHLVEPLRAEVRRAVAAGTWPLWAPRLGAGEPLLANPQAQALQPLTLPGLLAALGGEPARAAATTAALRTLLALVFSFLLFRRLGVGGRTGWGPALAGSLAYGCGGFLQLWLGWPLANSGAWMPAVLYGVVRVAEESRRRDAALLVAALFGLLTAGHPETIAMGLALAAGLVMLRMGRRWAEARALGGRTAAALGLALLLAAPALLPFAAWMPETLRWSRMVDESPAGAPDETGGMSAAETGVSPTPAAPATRVIQAAAPNALGNSRYLHYWGVSNSNEDAGGFVGTATLLAALLAAPLIVSGLFGRKRPALAHEGAFLALAAGCLVLLALPVGLSGRLALPLDLALAALAVATLERARRGDLPVWWTWGALPAAAVALAGFHFWIVPAFADPSAGPTDPATLEVLRVGWRHWHLRFLGAGAGLLFVCGALSSKDRWINLRKLAVLAVAALIGAELWLAHAPVNPPMPRDLYFPEAPALRAMLEDASPVAGPARMAAGGRVFLPNLAAVYGLGDARVYDPTAPAGYLELLAPAIERWTGEIPLLGPEGVDGPGGSGRARKALYDRLGIAWWLTAPETPCPPGTVEARLPPDAPDARLCRRPDARPLVGDPGAPGTERLAMDPGGDRWRVERASGSKPITLETAIHAAPGWRAVAVGEAGSRAIRPASDDPLLRADLPAGTRRVELLYRPAPFVLGCLLAALGLAMAAAWLARPPAAIPRDSG